MLLAAQQLMWSLLRSGVLQPLLVALFVPHEGSCHLVALLLGFENGMLQQEEELQVLHPLLLRPLLPLQRLLQPL